MGLVALTGGTGTLGRAVLDGLLASGFTVRALARPRPRALPERLGVEWLEGDLADGGALDALLAGADAVIHAAYARAEEEPPPGVSPADRFVATNVAGSLRLLARAGATRHRQFVYVSSLAVYGPDPRTLPGAGERPLDEDFPVWPREYYAAHKAAVEKMVVAAAGVGGNACAFRLGAVLGDYAERDRDPLWSTVREAIETGEVRSPRGAFVLAAEDAAAILVGAIGDSTLTGQVMNTFHRFMDYGEVAQPLSEILGREIRLGRPLLPAPPLRKDRLRAREPAAWRTEEKLRSRLRALARGA